MEGGRERDGRIEGRREGWRGGRERTKKRLQQCAY